MNLEEKYLEIIEKYGLSAKKQYQMNEDFLLREIAGETVMVPVGEMSEKFNGMGSLNGTAAFLWRAFQEPATIEEVYAAVMEDYEGEESILEDICGFARESLSIGFMNEV